LKSIEIDIDHCKGCQLCVEVCPQEVFELSTERNAKGYLLPSALRMEDCTGCLQCEMTCPDLAITVVHDNGQKGVGHAQ
jgi:2-oxoglutarate ferredoxin oxidoreductase subunit delta